MSKMSRPRSYLLKSNSVPQAWEQRTSFSRSPEVTEIGHHVFKEVFSVEYIFFLNFGHTPQHVGPYSSLTRDQTCPSCCGRQSLNHWTTRDVPHLFFLWPMCRYTTEVPLKFEARENMSDQQQFILAPRDPAAHPRTMPSGPSGLFVTGICWECGNKLRFLECYFAPSVTLNALYVLR